MKLHFLAVAGILFLTGCADQKPTSTYDTIEYGIFFGDNEAGFFTASMNNEGTYEYVFEFNDRGRGPHLEQKIKIGEEGYVDYLEVKGNNYFKDSVNETLSLTEDKYQWKSRVENGSKPVDSKRFYIPLNSTFGDMEHLANQLLGIKDRKVSLLPEGIAMAKNAWPMQVNDSLQLTLVEITGLSFTPTYIWMKNDRFFASVSGWLSCLPNGYKSLSESLLSIQKEKENQYYTDLATEYTEKPEGQVAITNVNLFNSKTGQIEQDRTIIIEGNKIVKVQKGSAAVTSVTKNIDGEGKTAIPGLIDMHAHVDRADGLLNIAAGVTSVRDLANSLELLDMKEEFENNTIIGTRIPVYAGFIDQAGPYAGPVGQIVTNLDEGLEAIDFYHGKGYQQVKLYSSIDPEWVEPMAKKAHQLGVKVSGHIPSYMIASQAVNAGYDEIQHINMIALNFLSDTIDTRTPLRFSMVGEYAHSIDVKGEEFQSFIKLLKEKNTIVDPTVSIFEGMLTTGPGEVDPSFEMIIERLPVNVKRGYYSGGLPASTEKRTLYKKSYNNLLKMVRELYDNDIPLVAGTDAMPGFALHTELENYVRAGIPANEVLRIATMKSAEILNMSDQIGAIEEGMLADIVLVEGNPVEDISTIRNTKLTIKDGLIFDPAKLYSAYGIGVN